MRSGLPQARYHRIPYEPRPQEDTNAERAQAITRIPHIGTFQPLEIYRYLRSDALSSSVIR